MPAEVKTIGFPEINRGVAILDDTIVVGTLDAHLVALDAHSGAVRWDVHVADNALGFSITAAPLAIDGAVVVGVAGAEAGIRGFLDAYDIATGERVWRFWTVPAPGEPGSETWGGNSWETGGGSTWLTGSYDPDLGLLYWGIGNPAPDWNGDVRPGDNLYTCALVALDANTGELAWYFQFTPHDVHDWDANQIPVLVDTEVDGVPRKVVAMANRNAFYYLLDRETGEFLLGTPYAKQTWAEGLMPDGRPMVLPNTEPTAEGTLVYPSLQGATNWFSPSYSPRTELFYVSVRQMGAYYFKGGSRVRARGAVPRRRRAGAHRRRGVWGHSRPGGRDGSETLGVRPALTAVGRGDGHGRRPRVRRNQRGQRVRARCGLGRATLGVPDRRRRANQPHGVRDRRGAARRGLGRQRRVRLRVALAARGKSPAAVGQRCIPPRAALGIVHDGSNTPGIVPPRALPAGRSAALGATQDFCHGRLVLLC